MLYLFIFCLGGLLSCAVTLFIVHVATGGRVWGMMFESFTSSAGADEGGPEVHGGSDSSDPATNPFMAKDKDPWK